MEGEREIKSLNIAKIEEITNSQVSKGYPRKQPTSPHPIKHHSRAATGQQEYTKKT